MRFFIFTLSFCITLSLNAQKKVSFDLNAGVLKSVGKDLFKNYNSSVNPLILTYYSRKKFKHPYFNLLSHIQYQLTTRFAVGLESGIYFHYWEKYFSDAERTTISIPVMVTLNHKIFDINSRPIGIELSVGGIFFNINDVQFRTRNGMLYNASAYYRINKKSILKLGAEKEVDKVWFYFQGDEPPYKNETYKYNLNRLSVLFSYRYILSKN